MKKIHWMFSLLAAAALFLAACGEASNNDLDVNQAPVEQLTQIAQNTPEGTASPLEPTDDLSLATSTAEGAADEAVIPSTGDEAGQDATPEATDLPTLEADLNLDTPTPAASADQTATPDSGAVQPSAPMSGHDFGLYTELIGRQVQSADGQPVGLVTGVLIERPVAGADAGSDFIPESTQSADDDAPEDDVLPANTPTPASQPGLDAGDEDNLPGPEFGLVNGPRIAYLLVDVTAEQGTGALEGSDLDAQATPLPTAVGDTGTNPLSQPAGGADILIPWYAFDSAGLALGVGGQQPQARDALVLNANADVVAAAPILSDLTTGQFSVPDYDAAVRQYWNDSGLAPQGGSQMPDTPRMDQPSDGTDRSGGTREVILLRADTLAMDLTDTSGEALGRVTDFVIDLNSGQLLFAILSGEGTLEGRMYLVPFDHLTWQSSQPASGGFADPGSFTTDFPPGVMEPGMPWQNTSPDV